MKAKDEIQKSREESSKMMSQRQERPLFLSEAECREVLQRLVRLSTGGGYIAVGIESRWTGNVRWARNQVSTSGEVRNNDLYLLRSIDGACNQAVLQFNESSDAAFLEALRRAEWLVRSSSEAVMGDLIGNQPVDPGLSPAIFNEATYQLDADQRAKAARNLAQSATDAGMLSSGYVEVSAYSRAMFDNLGRSRYCQWTFAQYSVTVRDPKGTGSGWAGLDHNDWATIDGPKLSQIALQKCLMSCNPIRVEPGRYTTILEPQAVCDLVEPMIAGAMRRRDNEGDRPGAPFWKARGVSMIGEKIMDERITISSDPMDTELGYPSWSSDYVFFRFWGETYHPITWIEHGVLKDLSYDREYAIQQLGRGHGLGGALSFRMSGGSTSIDEMISTTKRGLLVTRFDRDRIFRLDARSQQYGGYTRDGLWFIEDGKITRPCKNMAFVDSPLLALNKIEKLGVPQRVYRPPRLLQAPGPMGVIVPALKVQDFSFTALADAV